MTNTDLFQDAISEPIVDTFIAKLRYRLATKTGSLGINRISKPDVVLL